ncbi:MAG: hypothetical protein KDD66_18210 [Bdellovibrionales bacterium]|nr:hypothetical protein [Bdellovibrionales bacterium]
MINPFRSLLKLFTLLFAAQVFAANFSYAQQTGPYVPDQLRPWVEWVYEKYPDLRCALLNSNRSCVWPGSLKIDVGAKGAKFRYQVRVDKRIDVSLPGGDKVWPLDVAAADNGSLKPVAVLEASGRPSTQLERGTYEITGNFEWEEIPESILVPADAGIVEVKVLGSPIANPRVSPSGELWLRSRAKQEETQQDSIHIEVQRLFSDGVPFNVSTRVEVRIAGGARDIDLGNVLIPGSQPHLIRSILPYRLDSNNRLALQGKPGVYEVMVEAVLAEPPQQLEAVKQDVEGWPNHEIWVWQADETFRSVEISGASAIDPSRTRLRDDWKGRPTYIVQPAEKLVFTQTRRGEQSVAPNRIDLKRTFWLDLDGNGFTIRDDISGSMHQQWRLDAQPEMNLGNVRVSGSDQLITANQKSKLSGVELRSQNFNLTAASRIDHQVRSLSAVGWNHDVDSLQLQLNLPPGWNLFEASGADSLSSSWLENWTLLDLFFVLLVAGAAGKLLGLLWGAVALTALVLGFDQPGAPMQIWVHLLVCIALIRLIPAGLIKTVIQTYFAVVYVFLVVIMVGFCLDQVRSGLFPQLTPFGRPPSFDPLRFLTLVLDSGLGGAIMVGLGIAAVVLLIMRRWRYMFLALAAIAALFVFQATTSVFYSNYGSVSRDVMNLPADMPASPQVAQVFEEEAYEAMPMKREAMPKALDSYSGMSFGSGASDNIAYRKQKLTQVDPRAVVQTGPGLPNWSWRNWTLRWNGPVKKDHPIQLYLLSPGVNLLLSLVRVALFLALSIAFLNREKFLAYLPKGTAASICLLCLFGKANVAHADDFPDQQLLNDLSGRLTADMCRANCSSASKVEMNLSEREMMLRANIHSRGDSAWPIPGPVNQFLPQNIKIDGKATSSLRRERDGVLWVRIPDGVHEIEVSGHLVPRNVVTLHFSLPAKHVVVKADNWSTDGISSTGSVSNSVQFTRKALTKESSSDTEAAKQAEPEEKLLSQWYRVSRTLRIGLPWEVETVVTRLGDLNRPAHTRIPLLTGESVTTDGIKVVDKEAVVSFARNVGAISWNSSLEQEPEISLTAGKSGNYSEIWVIECSPIWRCSYSGIKPTTTIEGAKHIVRYLPWPDEAVKIDIVKPEGVPGDAVTIDSATAEYTPGVRLLRAALRLSIRSSQGGWQKVTLPEGAEVGEVSINGITKSIRPQGNELSLPLEPGAQQFVVNWQQGWKNGLQERMPEVSLDRGASNVKVTVRVPEKRWLLLTGGPQWGPAVLIWGKLVVVIIFALLLGKADLAPLKTAEWILLGLGLATLPAAALVIPFFWLAALSYRRHRPLQRRWAFNLSQVALVGLTCAAFIVLYLALRSGLILKPNMLVRGNGSSNTYLHWYVDRINGALPRPMTISLPIWVWRVVMLAWSTWLVFALLRWMRWGWDCFSCGGLWKSKGKPYPESNE